MCTATRSSNFAAIDALHGLRMELDASEWQLGLQAFTALNLSKMAPDVVSFNAAISSCEKGSNWQLALHLLSDMAEEQLLPDVISFSSTLCSLDAAELWPLALEIFAWLCRGLEPNVYSYNAVISSCQNGSQWQLALLFYEAMDGVLPDVLSTSLAVSSSAMAQKWHLASQLLDQLSVTGWSKSFDAGSHRVVALQLLQQMRETRDVSSDVITYSTIIGCCQGFPRWRLGLCFLQLLGSEGVCYDTLCFNQAMSGGISWRGTLQLLRSMPLKKVTGDVIGYSAAIHACSLVCGPWPGPGAEKTCDQRSRVPGLPGLSW
ncbi:unnamed protein product, partial [Cladocopium goreaui]